MYDKIHYKLKNNNNNNNNKKFKKKKFLPFGSVAICKPMTRFHLLEPICFLGF